MNLLTWYRLILDKYLYNFQVVCLSPTHMVARITEKGLSKGHWHEVYPTYDRKAGKSNCPEVHLAWWDESKFISLSILIIYILAIENALLFPTNVPSLFIIEH